MGGDPLTNNVMRYLSAETVCIFSLAKISIANYSTNQIVDFETYASFNIVQKKPTVNAQLF
jgi:hypothetical protein